MKHPFHAGAMAPTITAPLLALIAQRDSLIPPSYSQRLVQHWGGLHEVKLIEGADHNTIVDYEAYWQAIKIFLAQMRLRMEMTAPQINY
jgi:pimeloyl-ACP methyl ester carboxylesterase